MTSIPEGMKVTTFRPVWSEATCPACKGTVQWNEGDPEQRCPCGEMGLHALGVSQPLESAGLCEPVDISYRMAPDA